MSDFPSPDLLPRLRERWNRDRSSRLFLQLAEELRRAGEVGEAIEVLTEGLESHSESVAGLVALGRCQIETGATVEAARTLERALKIDPAQLVANKLITRAWLQLGDAQSARQRLEIYRLLNERDEEIEEYEARLEELEAADLEVVREAESADERPIFDLSPSSPPPVPALERRPETGSMGALANESPFQGLLSAADAERRAPVGMRDVSIFDLWPTLVPPSPLTAAPPLPVPPVLDLEPTFALEGAQAPAGVAAEAPAVVEDAAVEPEDVASLDDPELAEATTKPEPPPGTPAEPEVEGSEETPAELQPIPDASGQQLFSLTSIGDEVENEPIDEVARVGDEIEVAPARRGTESAAIPAASATLAALYLQQGHLEEAEREFRSVLELNPGDAAAVQGLERVSMAHARAEREAARPVVEASSADELRSVHAGGLTQRRVLALSDLLVRLRSRRGSHAGVS